MQRLTWRSTCEEVIKTLPDGAAALKDASVIITGCNAGIGKYTARAIASLGATTVFACRSAEKASAAAAEVRAVVPEAKIHCFNLDLSSLSSVESFVAAFRAVSLPPLKCLIMNAGVFAFADGTTAEGYDLTWGTNHLGHFYLAQLLLPDLKSAAPSRVVCVGSDSHFGPLSTKNWDSREDLMDRVIRPKDTLSQMRLVQKYGDSKLANTLFASEFHRRYSDSGVVACSLHPGAMMATDIARDSCLASVLMKFVLAPFTKSMSQGSSTTLLCALLPHKELLGQYFSHCQAGKRSFISKQESSMDLHWQLSEELIAAFRNPDAQSNL